MKERKNIFKRIKEAWQELDKETRDWLKVVGIWTIDGAMIGTICTAAHKNKQIKRVAAQAYLMGAHDGETNAYQNMIQTTMQPQYKPVGYVSNQMTNQFKKH